MESRIDDGRKIWKLSPMDLKSYSRWYDYSRARDEMFKATDTPWAPWFVIHSDDKKLARLNAITHILKHIPHEESSTREGEAAGSAEGTWLQGARLSVQICAGADVAIQLNTPKRPPPVSNLGLEGTKITGIQPGSSTKGLLTGCHLSGR